MNIPHARARPSIRVQEGLANSTFTICPSCEFMYPISNDKCPVCETPRYMYMNSAYIDSAIDLISGTVDKIKSTPPNMKDELDLYPIETRLNALEKDYKELKTTQDDIKEKTNNVTSLIRNKLETLDKIKELKDAPEILQIREALGTLEKFYQLNYEKITSSIIVKVLSSEINALDSRLSSKIESNTTIIDAYKDVLNQQKGLINILKWAIILVPVAVAIVPIIELLIKWKLNLI